MPLGRYHFAPTMSPDQAWETVNSPSGSFAYVPLIVSRASFWSIICRIASLAAVIAAGSSLLTSVSPLRSSIIPMASRYES